MSTESEFFEDAGGFSHREMFETLPSWEKAGIKTYANLSADDIIQLIEVRYRMHALTPSFLLPKIEVMANEGQPLKRRRHEAGLRVTGPGFFEFGNLRKREVEILSRLNKQLNERNWRRMDDEQRGTYDENN